MFDEALLISELSFKAIRSSGAGGQHVNKASTKIELSFNIGESKVFDEIQKEVLVSKLKTRLTKENILLLQCDESRSQHKNKAIAIERFLKLIDHALIIPKKRKKTSVPKAVKLKRLSEKRKISERKTQRKTPDVD